MPGTDAVDALGRVDLFQGLAPKDLAQVALVVELPAAPEGASVYR
jgi:hypothetical protein